MKRFEWTAMIIDLGIASLLVTAAPAWANDETKQGSGSTPSGSSSTQSQSGSTSGMTEGEQESGKKGTGAKGSGMGGESTGARPGEVSGAGTAAGASAGTAGKKAGEPTGEPTGNEVSGRIEAIDRANRTLTIANSEKPLKLTDDTEVIRNGEKSSPGDLMEGDEVRASFSGSGDNLQVTRVEVIGTGTPESGGAKGSGMGGTSTGARPGETTGGTSNQPTGSPSGTSTGKESGASSTGGGSPDTTGGKHRQRQISTIGAWVGALVPVVFRH
jgi:hypothetical protein